MKALLLVITLCVSTNADDNFQEIFSTDVQKCDNYEDVVEDYRYAQYELGVETYRSVFYKELGHFVISPLSVWVDLATIAEGTDLTTKLAMFKLMKLPLDPCIRLKYYQLATTRYNTSDDVHLSNTRALVIDEGVTMNSDYHNFVFKYSLLDVVSAPLQHDPQTALKEIRRVTSATLPNLELSGNSILLDTMDYNGLWNTAFEDAIMERSPFYSKNGEQIGTVDLMKVKKRVRRTYFRPLNIKAIEIPIGKESRYSILFALIVDNNLVRAVTDATSSIIFDFVNSFEESVEPIEIAIPRMNLTSEFDLRKTLEEFGLKNIWTDPTVTGSISKPAALPSGFIQRSTVLLDSAGLKPAPVVSQTSNNEPVAFDPVIGPNFIANRPFLFALLDTETYSCILAASFTEPTYRV